MYYIDKLKQNEIARRLKITPIMVSRYLREAESKGIVTFHVKMPWPVDTDLGKSISDKYGLQECYVLEVLDDRDIRVALGSFLADYFAQILPDNSIVGLSWGGTISHFAESLPYMNVEKCSLLQLAGAFSETPLSLTPSTLINTISKKVDGQIYTLNAPLYASSEEMRDQLVNDPANLVISELALKSDINIVGASMLDLNATTFSAGIVDANGFEELKALGVAGDLAGTFIDWNGDRVEWSGSKMYTGVPLDVIRKAKNVICIAGEMEKVPILDIVCRRKHIHTLITTKQAAVALLNARTR